MLAVVATAIPLTGASTDLGLVIEDAAPQVGPITGGTKVRSERRHARIFATRNVSRSDLDLGSPSDTLARVAFFFSFTLHRCRSA